MGSKILAEKFVAKYRDLRKAGFPAILIETIEPGRLMAVLAQDQSPTLRWDINHGIAKLDGKIIAPIQDPKGVIDWIVGDAKGESAKPGTGVIMLNFNRFFDSLEVVQAIQDGLPALKSTGKAMIVVAPSHTLPPDLERIFTVMQFALPDAEEIKAIIDHVAESAGAKPPANCDDLVQAVSGLTEEEAENSLSLSWVEKKKFVPDALREKKAEQVRKTGTLSVYEGADTFEQIGGLCSVKDFCLRAIAGSAKAKAGERAKGILLLGVPGTGKSAVAKALGNAVNRPTITLDFGAMFGSLVGQSERQMRDALKVVDAMSPCILFIDEIEKGLSGTGSSGQTDGGTTSRVFGTFLTWMNDRTTDVFVIATSNDVSALPGEFLRQERWDSLYFVDMPTPEQRKSIWKIWTKSFGIDSQPFPEDDGWTGAEIRSCCRLAKLLDVSLVKAADNVVPIGHTIGDRIAKLRAWAEGRCTDANVGGRYDQKNAVDVTPPAKGRKINA